MTENEYQILLSTFIPFGSKRLRLLESYFGSAENVWVASQDKLLEVGLSENHVRKFINHRREFNSIKYLERLHEHAIVYLHHSNELYPEILRAVEDAPYGIYIKGNVETLRMSGLAIVGTRKMTSYGKDVCETFARGLAREGLIIISGLARGVDTASHIGALSVRGKTIAVLACGLNLVYPPENHTLARKIVEMNGALISEYPLSYEARRENFPQRNRIVSALSKGVLVIEGEKKSGTLLTARHAAGQGRTVYAIPGNITNPMSQAPHLLIREGAILVTEPSDILSELGYEKGKIPNVLIDLSPQESIILKSLESEPLVLDDIGRITCLPISIVSATLIGMELKNVVKHLGGGIYRKM